MNEIPSDILTFIKFFENSDGTSIYVNELLRDENSKIKDIKLHYCNEQGAKLLQMEKDFIIGRNFTQLRSDVNEVKPEFAAFMESICKAGSEWRGIRQSVLSGRYFDSTMLCHQDDWIISIAKDLNQEIKEKDIFREAAYRNEDAIYYLEPVFDDKGSIIDFLYKDLNPAAEAEMGMPKEISIGKNLYSVFPQNVDIGMFDLFKKVYLTQQAEKKEYEIKDAKGDLGFYLLHISRVYEGLLISNKNITEIRNVENQLRIQKEQLEFTYLASNDGYWDYNVKTEQLFLSERWKTMLGYTNEEIASNDIQVWRKLVHPKDLRIALSAFQRHRSEETERFDKVLRFKTKGGEYIFVRSRALIIKDENGEPTRIVGTHTDISAAKQSEIALEKAKEKAEQADRAKSEFLGMISHEMRTPLNGIFGMTTLLASSKLDLEQKEYLKDLSDSTEILSRLIDDLLQVITVDSAKMEIKEEAFEVKTFLDFIRILVEPKAFEKNIEFKIFISEKFPRVIVGDRTRIEQVLLNLITNSIKFTDKGSITLSLDLEGEASILFKVKDTGIGIKEEARQRIFDAFHQEDLADTRKYKGVGLGLYIVKRLTSKMKGDVRLNSEPGHGSEFSIILPLKKEAETPLNPAQIQSETVPKFSSNSVLIVDDNEINVKILAKHLSKTGIQSDSALSGKEALKLLDTNEKKYDLILLDLQMPEMDGYHTADAIHALNSSNAKTPIVAVTASSFSEAYKKCAQHGIEGFIGKPFQPKQLYKVLTDFL
ncbi:hybrid sensor histidine kinase/response regulator [Leptospira hartskeerlii]|uniref:histidine kinase n=1 Tax=Leptospira hartskeerlii TaxID=2023177 RepID=A0A2M9XG59_9LEPT|nr:hybrid sensor histidine kinase/response regulator [Leptospira hartskeerlii]PJZ26666.1 hybrid sensor histidine kinase/response regulator [Leptospira hartskeerlii]PJZ34852.1 hybrid sensor histidine kinase/response regulator [Leptospira hartskeerlii]